jgi:hypothetical protein
MVGTGNTAVVNVGRLLEIRIALGFRNVSYIEDHFADIRAEIRKVPLSDRIVIAADWRFCRVMSTEATDVLVANLARQNRRIERSAILASANSPSTVLQFARLVREGGSPHRRLFMDADEMTLWLDEVLARDERQRLIQFLGEPIDSFGPAS